jgi:Zn-dependent peptidase ImmA (M78 family)/transcriptional regulator with XRE-family HTH domain
MTDSLFGLGPTAFVNGERVKQARELSGLTQSDLARRIGVTQAMVAHIEGGFKQPSDDVLAAIGTVTGLSPAFFYKATIPELPAGWVLYRARAGGSRKKLQRTHRYAQVVLEIALELSKRVKTIPIRISTSETSPEDAAKSTRKILGCVSGEPVSHLIRAVEKAGAIVLALPPDEVVDAFAVWVNGLPVIASAECAAGDRVRFTVAHELGHLVMHRLQTTDAELERQAYRFAAELLTPSSAILRDFDRLGVTLSSFAQLKLKWGASMQMLIRRARDLELVTERQYHYLMQQLSARGWRTSEPSNLAIPVERPRLLRRMAELVYGDPIDYSKMAKDFSLKVEFLASVMNRYAEPSKGKTSETAKVLKFARKRQA